MEIKISPNLRVVAGRLSNLKDNFLRNALANAMTTIKPEVEGAVKQETPGRGNLRRTIQVTSTVSPKSARLTITGDGRLKYPLKGTKPHIIRPRVRKMLAFVSRDGSLTFARAVNHPGQAANPFVDRAWAIVEPSVRQSLRESGLRAWRELSRFRG